MTISFTMAQRAFATVSRNASERSPDSFQNICVGASKMPSDKDRIMGPAAVTDDARSTIGNDPRDPRSAPSLFARTEALPTNMNPPNVTVVAELLARMDELLQPTTEGREIVLSVGPLQLDLLTRTVKRDAHTIDLRPREFRLLEYMMRRKGQVLTRSMLFEDVWNYKFTPCSNLVDVHMGRLRRKIDGPLQPPMIFNIRGQGFLLRAPD